jgi:hypothetical protein
MGQLLVSELEQSAAPSEISGQIFELGAESHDDLYYGLVWLLCGLVSHGFELPENTLNQNLSTGLRRFQIGGFEPHEAR